MTLRISHRVEQTHALGPGQRAALWVHGCCFQCPGCLAQRYKEGPYTEQTPEALAQWYLSIPDSDGLTISGGEPMLQAGPLARMVAAIRRQRDTGIIVYTGFVYENLVEKAATDPQLASFLQSIDLLIDGPFLQEKNDGKALRGSSNQRAIPLTDRYRGAVDRYGADIGRQIEISITDTGTVMVGVPDEDQLKIWQKIKAIGEKEHGAIDE